MMSDLQKTDPPELEVRGTEFIQAKGAKDTTRRSHVCLSRQDTSVTSVLARKTRLSQQARYVCLSRRCLWLSPVHTWGAPHRQLTLIPK